MNQPSKQAASDILALTETLYGLAVAQVSSQQHVGQEDMATLREARAEIARAKAVSQTPTTRGMK